MWLTSSSVSGLLASSVKLESTAITPFIGFLNRLLICAFKNSALVRNRARSASIDFLGA